jgi:hypothetical protein
MWHSQPHVQGIPGLIIHRLRQTEFSPVNARDTPRHRQGTRGQDYPSVMPSHLTLGA